MRVGGSGTGWRWVGPSSILRIAIGRRGLPTVVGCRSTGKALPQALLCLCASMQGLKAPFVNGQVGCMADGAGKGRRRPHVAGGGGVLSCVRLVPQTGFPVLLPWVVQQLVRSTGLRRRGP